MLKAARERQLKDTARMILADTTGTRAGAGEGEPLRERLFPLLEARFVEAAWTLRRLPDREAGFLNIRGSLWPETLAEKTTYAPEGLTSFQARRRVRITAAEVDRMQPTLDLLLLLPDIADRRILFWAAWHQNGESMDRIPWAKVRRSLGSGLSRWTMKRRYEGALRWLAALISLQS